MLEIGTSLALSATGKPGNRGQHAKVRIEPFFKPVPRMMTMASFESVIDLLAGDCLLL